ncbi:hypothetical protein J3L16_14960 [Alteromonas sp. 5E99-2]|uniref:hypothetical protein n=1 Tax=Alteromonas sp. 5E99-2 TaxID=2817683 RepID=UPI001A999176|nr:hypothetical protein [Alteromonas sp. 5E99-2]MBO1256992.1 hypothetical protein [Alteromonas sp. 5E99-2]
MKKEVKDSIVGHDEKADATVGLGTFFARELSQEEMSQVAGAEGSVGTIHETCPEDPSLQAF